MFTLLLLLVTHIGFLVGGIWIGYKNANSSKINAGKELIKALKSKE